GGGGTGGGGGRGGRRGGDGVGGGGGRARQVLEGHPADPARLAGDAVQRAVVEGDKHPVRRRLDVGLDVLVAEPHRVLERPPGVLRRVRRPTAVSEGQRDWMLKETGQHACEYALSP